MTHTRRLYLTLALAAAPMASIGFVQHAVAATAQDLDREAKDSLAQLYKLHPSASSLGHSAKAILVFPNIVKAGLIFGGSFGEGAMIQGAAVTGYYNSIAATWGLQAGAQSYGYAVFLMTDSAVRYVNETAGWELGVGPSVVLVDEGMAKNLSTSTLKNDAYAYIFNQQGLMAGIGIEGTKITRIKR